DLEYQCRFCKINTCTKEHYVISIIYRRKYWSKHAYLFFVIPSLSPDLELSHVPVTPIFNFVIHTMSLVGIWFGLSLRQILLKCASTSCVKSQYLFCYKHFLIYTNCRYSATKVAFQHATTFSIMCV